MKEVENGLCLCCKLWFGSISALLYKANLISINIFFSSSYALDFLWFFSSTIENECIDKVQVKRPIRFDIGICRNDCITEANESLKKNHGSIIKLWQQQQQS